MTIIIGIDPGSRITGYGIIQCQGSQYLHLASGAIHVAQYNVSERLQKIFSTLQTILQQYQPQEAAIEQIFLHKNPNSALKLGQARGAAIVALTIPIAEYSARQVKQSVVGYGAAKKEQVQHMVKCLLNLPIETLLQPDTADALAIALCHAHSRISLNKLGITTKRRSKQTSWRNYQPL